MADITIRINTDNAAFERGKRHEVARILHDAAEKIKEGGVEEFKLRDINGNTVGAVTLDEQRLTLQEIKNGTGFPKGVRFVQLEP